MNRLKAICLCSVALVILVGPAQADNIGVIFSGGVNARANYSRYYDNTVRIYELWTDTLGYKAENIYILAADGTTVGDDYNTGSYAAPVYADSDWSVMTGEGATVQSGTEANLQTLLTGFEDTFSSDDCFHFWSFDHGGNPTWDDDPVTAATEDAGYLCPWGSGRIDDDEFAGWVDGIDAKAESYWFGQCFAGDMADDLNILPGERRFAAWAADWTEPSWGDGWVDALADGIAAGLTGTHELAAYASTNDPWGQSGTGQEHPGWYGANFDVVTNDPIPEPATLALFGLGAAGLAWMRRRS